MPISSKKQSKAQLRYQMRRKKKAIYLAKRIQEDYIKLRLKRRDKLLIIKDLQYKYKRADGRPLSRQTIYNALNFREINRRIRATQACDPLLVARAEQGTISCGSTVLFLMNVPQSVHASNHKRINNNSSCKI